MPITVQPALVVLLLAVVLLCALVNGALGFGFAILAINVFALVFGPQEGVVVISLITLPLSASQLVFHRAQRGVWRRIAVVVAAGIVGSFIGAPLLAILPGWALALALGLFTGYDVAMMMRAERPPLRAHVERAVGPVVGVTAGVANGALGASGPVLGTYLVAIGLRGAEFAFAINLVFFTMGLVRAGVLGGLGLYTGASVLLSALLLLPSIGGQVIGLWMRGRVPAALLQRAILLALLFASVNLIWRGLQGALAALGVMALGV